MIKNKKNINEKWSYGRIYNITLIATLLIMFSLIISAIKTNEISVSAKGDDVLFIETIDNTKKDNLISENYDIEKIPFVTNNINLRKISEPEYYVVIEEITEESEHYYEENEYPVYSNLPLKIGLDTTRYALVYLNEDGKVLRIETIKGLVWDIKEFAAPAVLKKNRQLKE